MSILIPETIFDFLKELKQNNTREWMDDHKKQYLANEKALKKLYSEIENGLSETDEIAKVKVFRINRDLRFTPNKTPYNSHRSVSFSRAGEHRRGGYYLRLEPGNSFLAGGFFDPNPADLLRIRKEFELDPSDFREILKDPKFKKSFKELDTTSAVKTAPRGFDKTSDNLDLIRLKKYVLRHHFTDKEVNSEGFKDSVLHHFRLLRPFFDYMSSVITTDLNGVSLLDDPTN